MTYDRITTQPCIIPTPPLPDARCQNADFSLQHPDICSNSALIIKPDVATLCLLDSVQFRVFDYGNGIETELTDGVEFESSDPAIFAIGINSGNGTALGAGDVVITATYGTRTVQANITTQPQMTCCEDISVATAIIVDNSKSMSLGSFTGYGSRLAFAKAVATSYGGAIATANGVPKDGVEVWSVSSAITSLLAQSQDTDAITAAITGITQTQSKTDLLPVFASVATNLLAVGADRSVLLIVSDMEHSANGDRQAILDAAFAFKQVGGIVIVVAPRASGVLQGFDLAERVATGGFFINATNATTADVLLQLNYLKKLLCAGSCVDPGDRYENQPALNYVSFDNWEVVDGVVNLLGPGLMDFLPGNGLYSELSGQSHTMIRTIDTFDFVSGKTYRVSFKAAGNQQSNASQSISVSIRAGDTKLFEQTVFPAWNDEFLEYDFSFTAPYDASVRIYFEQNYAGTIVPGTLLDDIVLQNETDGATLLQDNFDGENLTYVPRACGMSAAVEAIADPESPTVEQVNIVKANQFSFFKYTYAYSWVTNEGETLATPVVFIPTYTDHIRPSRRIDMEAAPARAVGVRLWRSLGEGHTITFDSAGAAGVDGIYEMVSETLWEKQGGTERLEFDANSNIWRSWDASNGANYICDPDAFPLGPWEEDGLDPDVPTATMTYLASAGIGATYLLVELPVGETSYFDSENPVEFEARYESSVTAPTTNSTAFNSGGLSYGYADCCYSYVIPGESATPLIPAMTGNDTPDGYIASVGGLGIHEGEWWFAFDQTPGRVYLNKVGNGPYDSVGIQMPEAKIARSYSITTEQTLPTEPGPLGWQLHGSNNGIAWTLLDTQTGIVGWVDGVAKLYSINSPASFSFYRITITEATEEGFEPVISEFQLYGGGVDDQTIFVNNCPECIVGTLGVQSADTPGLADVETGTVPIQTTFNGNKCVSCPDGFVNISVTNLVPAMTSNTAPSGTASSSSSYSTFLPWRAFDRTEIAWISNAALPQWLQYQYPSAKTVAVYAITSYKVYGPGSWLFQGSTNGTTWITLDTRANHSWGYNQRKLFQITTPAAYAYYRVTASVSNAPDVGAGTAIAELEMFAAAPTSVCATGTSTDSQAAADAAATAAAQAQLNCVQQFTATHVHTAECPYNQVGAKVTKSETRTSLNGKAEARRDAWYAADAAAFAALICTGDNYRQQILIQDTEDSNFKPASPYPSVKFVSGAPTTTTKVVVYLHGFSHGSPDDVRIVLMSPTFVAVELMRNCGGSTAVGGGLQSGGVCPGIELVFDQTGGALPDSGGFAAGTYRPTQFGVAANLPMPAPQTPYGTSLNDFNGANPNGSWSLWVVDDLGIFPGKICAGFDLVITA